MDLPVYIWLPVYFNSMFSIARTYKENDKNCSLSMYRYFESLSNILPNKFFKTHFKLFLKLDRSVINVLLNLDVLNSFFTAFPSIKDILINNPSEFLNQCYNNSELMFMYVYLMYIYMCYIQNELGYKIHYNTYFDLKKIYNPNQLTTIDWGRPTWFVIHISSLYSEKTPSLLYDYKQFLESLQYILPCQKCQEHLRENLKFITFDDCGKTDLDLFRCSWKLHNIVNRSLNKYTPSFEEALNYYSIDNLKKNTRLFSYSI